MKKIFYLLALLILCTNTFAQECPFIDNWDLIDIKENRKSVMDRSGPSIITLHVSGPGASNKYWLSICNFSSMFEIEENCIIYSGKMKLKHISTSVMRNYSLIMRIIDVTNSWKLTGDTLYLYNETYTMSFVRKLE